MYTNEGARLANSQRMIDDLVEEEESADAATGGLEPRRPRPIRRRRRWLPALIGVGVVVAVIALVVNLLGDTALFFYNADEAVARRAELASERIRVQGTPVDDATDTFLDDQPVLAFTIAFDGTLVDVVHSGDPRELFQPGVPVVLEGAWRERTAAASEIDAGLADDGWFFASDRMLVKHDNDYINQDEYEQRVDEATRGGTSTDEAP